MRAYLIAALTLLPIAAQAAPAGYMVECTSSCTAPDGTTQPAGTFFGPVVVDLSNDGGWQPTDGAGKTGDVKLVPYTGQTPYTPPLMPAP